MSIVSDLHKQEREAQIAFEEQSDERAFEILLRKRDEDLTVRGDEDIMVQRVIRNSYEIVHDILEDKFKTSRGNSQYLYINKQVGADIISALSLTLVFRFLLRENEASFQRLSHSIGRAIVTESMVYQVEKLSPLYARRVRENLERKAVRDVRHIQGVYRKALDTISNGEIEYSLTPSDYVHLGKYALDAIYEAGLLKLNKRWVHNGEMYYYTLDEGISGYVRSHEGFKSFFRMSQSAKYMTVEPDPWTSQFGGGYLSERRKQTNGLMVNYKLSRAVREALYSEFNADNYPLVFEVANYIQSIPFKISNEVLELIEKVWEADLGLFGITKRNYPEFMPFPFGEGFDKDNCTEEERQAFLTWCRGKADWYTGKKKHSTKVFNIYSLLQSVPRDTRIWFVSYIDSRGRYYYSSTINPQGDDMNKALLQFADKKPLGKRGLFWLKAHLATSLGYDAHLMELRVKYVDEHWEQISKAVEDPITYAEVFGNESPIVAYVTALDIKRAIDSGNPETFESGIPVHLDATVSGTQHFSAMLLDPVGALFSNLIDNGEEKKSDLYMHVASKVLERIQEDYEEAVREYREFWLGHSISRNMAKKPVMTFNYAVTKITVADYVREVLAEEGVQAVDGKTAFYLADKIFEGVAQAIPATYQGMEFLKGCAREKGTDVITWTTPLGFKVYHDRPKRRIKEVKVKSAGINAVVVREEVDGCNKSDMVSAIAPNFIHSHDGAHLGLTALALKDKGLSGVFIHDSIGTHPCDVDVLNTVVRETFVDMYRGNILQDFKESLEVSIEVPERGSLNIEDVLKSPFFFC